MPTIEVRLMAAKKRVKWREYQEQTAEYFRSLGMNVEVEAIVDGVRGTHEIDVWVTFRNYGIEQRWVVECKRYDTSKVSKDKVLTLASIIEDVGAHAGFILSETGFQSGAVKSAHKTNIELTNLRDLQKRSQPVVLKRWTTATILRISEFRQRLVRYFQAVHGHPTFNRSFIDHLGGVFLQLGIMEQGITDAQNEKPLIVVGTKQATIPPKNPGESLVDGGTHPVIVGDLIGALSYCHAELDRFERALSGAEGAIQNWNGDPIAR
jgi:Restriction endonuclease